MRTRRWTLIILTGGLAAWPRARQVLRRGLHRFICAWLRFRSRPVVFNATDRTLIIAPHQDDASLGCGGLILRRRLAALPVDVLYITDGRASHFGHPRLTPDAVAAMRKQEAHEAMRILGVEPNAVHFLDAADGTLESLDAKDAEMLSQRLADRVHQLAPTEILLPCRRDGSSEHDATFRFLQRALALNGLKPRVLEYPIWARWNPLLLAKAFFDARAVWRLDFHGSEALKHRAIAAYVSQVQPTSPWPESVLPTGFVAFFSAPREFFFEHEQ